jgi:hypothetical protein
MDMAGSVDLQIFSKNQEIDYDPWTSGDGAGHIHCTTFELLGSCGVDVKTGVPNGTRDYGQGLRVTKRLDATSPKLLELFNQRTGLTAEFKFHMPDTSTSACALQVALAVLIGEGDCAWIRSYRLVAPDTDTPAAGMPREPYEEITFSFKKIQFQRLGKNYAGEHHNVIATDDLSLMTA